MSQRIRSVNLDALITAEYVVLATDPNSRVGLGSCSTYNRTLITVLTIQKTRTIGNGLVLPPKTRHFKSTILAPISNWVLIISWHDQYVDCAVLAPLSHSAVRYPIGPILAKSLSKTGAFRLTCDVIPQRFNEYWSDHKSESVRWKSGENCTIYILIMSWYDQNSNTCLELNLQQQ